MARKLFLGVLSMIFGLSLLSTSCSVVSNLSNKLQSNDIATVVSVEYHEFDYNGDGISVTLQPSSGAVANQLYMVDLYENGKFRDTQTISWDESNLQVSIPTKLIYVLPDSELNTYLGEGKNANDVFSVKIHKSNDITHATESILINQNEQASITIRYPNGGEIWHVGNTVTIKWTSTNLSKDAIISIELYTDYEHNNISLPIDDVANTGSYKWTINPIMIAGNNFPVIGSHARIELMTNGGAYGVVLTTISANDFTIIN